MRRHARHRPRVPLGQLTLLPRVYGLDIETDTTADGLDPRVARVVAVAVSAADGPTVLAGPERALLRALDTHLRRCPPGVLVTWNGAAFDLPFLADRARQAGVRLGLHLRPDDSLAGRHPPLPGHAAAYRARWHGHVHLDACLLYRALAGDGRSCALKPLARRFGLPTVDEDASRIHELSPAALRRYVAQDALLARLLAERCWLDAGAYLDVAASAP